MPTFSIAHDLLVGFPAAVSGTASFYLPNTLTPLTIFGDDTGTAISNPVSLDSRGAAKVWLTGLARMIVQSSTGVTIADVVINREGDTQVANSSAAFTGTTQKAVNDSALVAFGGQDFTYVPSGAWPGMTPKAWMNGVWRNVKAYGAKGDGVTLDDSAIAAAVADVAAAGGGTVYLPPTAASYLISGPITLTSKNGVNFVGGGIASTTIKLTNGSANAFTLTSCSGFTIANLNITHSSTSTGAAIALVACVNALVSQVGSDGITLTGTYAFGVSVSGAATSNITIDKCALAVTTNAGDRSVKYNPSGTSRDFYLSNTILVCAAGYGVEYTGTATYGHVRECSFTSCLQAGILWNAALTGLDFTVSDSPSLRESAIPLTINTATDPRIAQRGNNVDGYQTTVASGGTFTPDRSKGNVIRVSGTSTGVAFTVAAPTPTPLTTMNARLTIIFCNDAAGAITGWTTNAVYHLTGAISTTDTQRSTVTLEWDRTASVWREASGRAVTT